MSKSNLQKLKDTGYDPISMPEKIKHKWLEAMRSGEYEQTTGSLYKADCDGDGNPGFCCLGVLQHCLTGGVEWDDSYNNALGVPTNRWLNAWNITHNHWSVFVNNKLTDLTELNDDKLSFKQIANIIEQQVVGI